MSNNTPQAEIAKNCSKCGKNKALDQFYWLSSQDSHMAECKECILERRKAHRAANIERYKEKDIRYHQENRTHRNKYLKKWQKENLHIRRDKDRMRYNSDTSFAMRQRIHTRILRALKRGSKYSTSEELLGCSINEFKTFFSSKFTKSMSWELFMDGSIHVDHIIPCAIFDLSKEEDQYRCFHYSNLQPLFAGDNLKKGAKLEVQH